MHLNVLSLIDAFAAASLDGMLWQSSLEGFATATGSARGQLIGIGSSKTATFNFISTSDEGEHKRFDEVASYDPAVNFRVAAAMTAAPMTIIADPEYDKVIPRLTSDAYTEYCYEADMMFGCQTTLMQGDEGLIGLSMLRSRSDGRMHEEHRATFAAVAPHVRSAVRVQQMLEKDSGRLVAGTLDMMNIAAFACDERGRVRHYSTAAERILRSGRLMLQNGRLKSAINEEADAFDKALKIAIAELPGSITSTALVHGGDPIVLDIVSLPQRPWNLGFKPSILVVARGRDNDTIRSVVLLKAAYGLSDAEAYVAISFAQGKSRERIARERGVSVHTVRVQTKALFWKMDVNREAMLAMLVAKFL